MKNKTIKAALELYVNMTWDMINDYVNHKSSGDLVKILDEIRMLAEAEHLLRTIYKK